MTKEAYLYRRLKDNLIQCELCAHRCKIKEGKRGICKVREVKDGILYSLVYPRVVSTHIDPIEKKPFFHFMPGSTSFSMATVGCNLSCRHCQNHSISHPFDFSDEVIGDSISPEEIVDMVKRSNCNSISYTYTEPTIFFEYAYETAKIAHDAGIKNNFVTNGFMTPETLREIGPFLDAANIDLKSFSDKFYRRICGARLKPVLESIALAVELGIWVEVTTLVIPTLNDKDGELREIAEFIFSLSPDIPWHVSAFHPTYKMTNLHRTPISTLARAREIGLDAGLNYVYTGNVPGDEGERTHCPKCKTLIIDRVGFSLRRMNMDDGKCGACGASVRGVWG